MAGNVAGGFHVGGESRMNAAGHKGVPQLVVPGCLDFIVFGPPGDIPQPLRSRPAYYHNPQFTLVRITKDEQVTAARNVAKKLNEAKGPVQVLVPLGGISIMDIKGGPFWDEDISAAYREALRSALRSDIAYEELPHHINDDAFADSVLSRMLAMVG
jgi:uncharacterized protein (UPF0261 family)